MKLYITENGTPSGKSVVLDDLILTKDMPTTAGSKMLDGYKSLFNATVADKLADAGYSIAGKANIGEFSLDLLGETSYFGATVKENGELTSASAEIVKNGNVKGVVTVDVNGTPRRAAALSGLVFVKPTYGTVSRFGTVPVACSGETIGVMAKTTDDCRELLGAIVGYDAKDGTSHADEKCALVNTESAKKNGFKIALATSLYDTANSDVKAKTDEFKTIMRKNGVEVCEIDAKELTFAKTAWNVLMCAEMCNNVSRYDGIKYGYRSPDYKTIDELYTNSRTEAFGDLTKTAILFGSDCLSTENYMKVYDKSLRVRRVISEYFGKLFSEYDAVLMPACSKTAYTENDVKSNSTLSFDEALYTAPASITGMPAVVIGGVQLVANAFSEGNLFEIAKIYEKEGK